ncbi:MAG: sensor histidine kinase [Bowdeniella nasicola]|nr:sensor histidine kinase [Bowdeniella nasicola]
MSNLNELLRRLGGLAPRQAEWLHLLVGDWQLISDLAFADLVLWVPDGEGFTAVAHCRPSTGSTVHHDDVVGRHIPEGRRALLEETMRTGTISRSAEPRWTGSYAVREDLVPVRFEGESIAVVSREANLGTARSQSRLERNYQEAADDLCAMMTRGEFPSTTVPGYRRGTPRVGDGMVRLDPDGAVLYVSPNGLSCLHRLGVPGSLTGQVLAEAVTESLEPHTSVDETLPVVLMGRAAWLTEVESYGVNLTLRAQPITNRGTRLGAVLLVRDVSEVRRRERELLTKDATIREIHHRVKNNLQTVAALLRLQVRRSTSEETRAALTEAQRRVATIASVHETLSQTIDETVDFDDVFVRVLRLAADVASPGDHPTTKVIGSFGFVGADVATSLSVVLTELVSNAVEHGYGGRAGEIEVEAIREDGELTVYVRDSGCGLGPGGPGSGLGTQIVRTLVHSELRGTISWSDREGGGTEVVVHVHLHNDDAAQR